MPTQTKVQEVERLKERFEQAVSLVLADYRGLTANEMVELREKFTTVGLEYRVVKDTLARLAADAAGIEGLSEMLAGPISIAIGFEDPATPFKVSEECRKAYAPHYELRGGLFEGVLVRQDEVKRYATLPTREELLAKLAMLLQSPIRALAFMLQAKIRELAIVLSAVSKKKAEDPSSGSNLPAESAGDAEAQPAIDETAESAPAADRERSSEEVESNAKPEENGSEGPGPGASEEDPKQESEEEA